MKSNENSDDRKIERGVTRRMSTRRNAASGLRRAREIPRFVFDGTRTDVRGWRVYSRDAHRIGVVESMLVDMYSNAVRYLGIALDDVETDIGRGTVLVPIGAAARAKRVPVVVLPTISSGQLAAAPRMTQRPVTRADEGASLASLGIATAGEPGTEDFYSMPVFSESRLFG